MERKDHYGRRGDLQWSERDKTRWYEEEEQQVASQLPHHSRCQFAQINRPVVDSPHDDETNTFPNYPCRTRHDNADSSQYISERVCTSRGNRTWPRTSQQPARKTDPGNSSPLSDWPLGDMKCFDHKEPYLDQLLDEELKTLDMEGLSYPCGQLDFTGKLPSLYCSGMSCDGCNLQNREKELASSDKPYALSDAITNREGMTEKDSQENGCLSSIPQLESSVSTRMFLERCFEPGSYGDHSFPFRTDDNLSFLDNLDCIRSANASQEDGVDKCDEFIEHEGKAESHVKVTEDVRHPVKMTHRKSSKRQRNKSVTKDNSSNIYDKEDVREHTKKNSKSSANKQRHSKAERKRQHAENRDRLKIGVQKQTEELLWRCVTYVKVIMDVILFVTHKCGEYVETGGKLVYSCCQIQKEDFISFKGSARTSSVWLFKQAKLGSEKLRRFCLSLMKMTLKFLKMLLALLFLVLMLFIGCLRLGYKYAKSGVFMIFQRLPIWGQENFPHLVAVYFLHCLCSSIEESRTWNYLKRLWEKLKMRFWLTAKWRTAGQSPSSPPSPQSPGGNRYQPDQEVDRLLAMADVPEEELDPFKVLGVEVMATDAELKKAYRQLAVLVHPDKNRHPRSEEAFKVVRAAWDIVSNPERRKEYEIKRAAESELHRSMNEFLTKLQDDLKEAMNTMMCSKCEGKHKRFEMDRDPQAARYCAECNKRHPVEDGDFWAESSMLGLKITYFAMMDGKVYDITEWAGCQRVGISPDIHLVPCHISFATRTSGSSGRHRAGLENGPASPADLQEFFSKIFQGAAPQANGSFFNPSQMGHNSQAKGEPTQRTDAKQKRRKKVRRTFPR
ncbi:dnaJ homolog subfamily C member 14 [Pristis pectinata]|uniref:dnaJ homolog subfamily C member 14 n=1 Tax=Pristis pectinata TaxID=685728 RepID=UPI00223CDE31|nr:dnaJ homolog subfamily C member 14 [Pristis pectinata]XP_051865327.1 dnaJ homolog subfamily C member 14 [Pristis pectinata]